MSAAKVYYAYGPVYFQPFDHPVEPLRVQTSVVLASSFACRCRCFGRRLGCVLLLVVGFGVLYRPDVSHQAVVRCLRQLLAVSEVASCDYSPRRVFLEPSLAVREQLLDFGVSDPVVLRVVEYG